MPKVKTNSSAKKRFKISGSGKVRRRKAYKSHLLTRKKKDRKKRLGKWTDVNPTEMKRVKRMLHI
jgi:large subunit ribosomal protein L35